MFPKIYLGLGGAICLWFAIGAVAGWKGWSPALSTGESFQRTGTGTNYGGHRSTGFGGWGGGK